VLYVKLIIGIRDWTNSSADRTIVVNNIAPVLDTLNYSVKYGLKILATEHNDISEGSSIRPEPKI
jgi:hypothetical protein